MNLTAFAVLLFGLWLLAMGIYTYRGRGAEAMYRRVPMGPFVNVVYGQIPYGIAFMSIGIGMLLPAGGVSDFLLVAGLGFAAIGVLLWFWHPYAIRPHWMRNAYGD